MDSLGPQPGPQQAFSATSADIALFGGSAGPGKSWALVYEPTRHIHRKGFSGVIFRRKSPELIGAGSVWEEASTIYPRLGGVMRESRLDVRFPAGALIEFAHCQYEQDLASHQSKAYCYIGIDELTQFTERQFWFLIGRNRSTCGVRPYFRAATNPDADSFVRELIDWWIDGDGYAIPERSGVIRWLCRVDEELVWGDSREEVEAAVVARGADPAEHIPKSFTFISAKLEDNPMMEHKDPGYRASLQLLQRVDRLRFLGGNWDVRAVAGELYQAHWFETVHCSPADVVARGRFWDKAGTDKTTKNDPAWTVGALWSMTAKKQFYVEDIVRFQGNPLKVEEAIENTAKLDGRQVEVCLWQDPGQAGKTDVAVFARLLAGWPFHAEVARLDKVTYAKPASAQAERGNIKIVQGPWNKCWLREHENFPDAKLKDQPDTTSLAVLRLTGGGRVEEIEPDPDAGYTGNSWDPDHE